MVAYDPFSYAAGSLTAQNGGSGFSGMYTAASSGGSSVSAAGFGYTDANSNALTVAGNKADFVGNNQGEFRSLTTAPQATGTTLYVSFVMQLTTANAYAGLSLFAGTTETLFLGEPGGALGFFGIDTKSGSTLGSTTPTSTKSLLVYRIDFLATSATIRLYLNPTLGTEPTTASLTATKTAALTYDSIRIQSGGTTAGSIDEIRLGTTYADVTPIAVPEPTTMALVLLGTAGMLRVLRRRRA